MVWDNIFGIKIKRLINQSEIISFDIFDTLLARPYLKPVHLFSHMEEVYNADGFAKERIDAEKRARQKHSDKEEITFDDIYEEIGSKYFCLKEKEFSLEKQVLYVNPKIKEILDYALSKNKKIILTSDMYLPTKNLEEILEFKNISGYQKLYVSCEYLKTKYSGKLFEQVLEDFQIQPSQLLHFGDNRHSDYQKPGEHGIKVFYTPSPVENFLKKNIRWKELIKIKSNSLTISIILGLIIKQHLQKGSFKTYWHRFGYEVGGAASYGFSKFVSEKIKEKSLNEAIFIARDGYTIEKIFNLINNNEVKTHYVYAPRIINSVVNLDYKNSANWRYRAKSFVNYFKKYYPTRKLGFKSKLFGTNYTDYIENNLAKFIELSALEQKKYQEYLSGFNFKEKQIALVDLSAESFSSIKLLRNNIANSNFYGIYWLVANYANTNGIDFCDYIKSRDHKQHNVVLSDYELLEFLITAPELPVETIRNGKPIYITNKYEIKRAELYKTICEEEINFAKDMLEVFGENLINFSCEDITEFLNRFLSNLSLADRMNLAQIYHGISEDHSVYKPLINTSLALDFNVIANRIKNNLIRLRLLRFLFD